MRYVCPKCGESFPVRPANGACPLCGATVVSESETHEAEPRGERDGLPSPKRRL